MQTQGEFNAEPMQKIARRSSRHRQLHSCFHSLGRERSHCRLFVLFYLLFRSFVDAALVMAAVPFALVGGFWLVWALGHAVSVATAVGFIALAGLAAEFGVVMLVYLQGAHARRLAAGEPDTEETLLAAIREGAVLRVRPKAMTVAVVLAGLLPLMWATGTGSEVMTRIAAPMVGGMVTAPLLSMLVMPAAWYLVHRRRRSYGDLAMPPMQRNGRLVAKL